MRKLYNKFFRISENEKISEIAMLNRMAMTIAVIVVCLAVMSITAFAYFSCNVTSNSNFISAANFLTDVTVQVTGADGNSVENSNIVPVTSDNRKFVVRNLVVGKWYNVSITQSSSNTANTGFIIVSAEGCPVTYHTQQLGVDKSVAGEFTPSITFKMMITDATDVVLEAHWGTSSFYSDYQINSVNDERYITLDEKIKFIVNGHKEPFVNNISNQEQNKLPTVESEPFEQAEPTKPLETTQETTFETTQETTFETTPERTPETTAPETSGTETTAAPTPETTEPPSSVDTTFMTTGKTDFAEPQATDTTDTIEEMEAERVEETTGAPTNEEIE